MAEFPRLRTNAVAQYPAQSSFERATEVLRFIDGSEQRFRRTGEELRSWQIQLEQLDDREMHAIREFFTNQAGRFDTFSFWDPWTETEYPACRFDTDVLQFQFSDIQRGQLKLAIREVKQ